MGDTPDLPPAVRDASLAELAQLMPLGLGMILYARAMMLLGAGCSRALALPVLRQGNAAIKALQDALARRSLTDGLSADLARVIAGEILLCQADAGDAACVAGLVAFGDLTIGWRGFILLVNAGAMDQAEALKAAMFRKFRIFPARASAARRHAEPGDPGALARPGLQHRAGAPRVAQCR